MTPFQTGGSPDNFDAIKSDVGGCNAALRRYLLESERLFLKGDFAAAAAVLECVTDQTANTLDIANRIRLLVRRARYLRHIDRWSEARSFQLIAQRLFDSCGELSLRQDYFDLCYGHACDAIQFNEPDVAVALLERLQNLADEGLVKNCGTVELGWARLFSKAGKHFLAVFKLAKMIRSQVRDRDRVTLKESLDLLEGELQHINHSQMTHRVRHVLDRLQGLRSSTRLSSKSPLSRPSRNSDDHTRGHHRWN